MHGIFSSFLNVIYYLGLLQFFLNHSVGRFCQCGGIIVEAVFLIGKSLSMRMWWEFFSRLCVIWVRELFLIIFSGVSGWYISRDSLEVIGEVWRESGMIKYARSEDILEEVGGINPVQTVLIRMVGDFIWFISKIERLRLITSSISTFEYFTKYAMVPHAHPTSLKPND